MAEIENRILRYNYIKKLAIFLKKENLEELFTALVLCEKYSLIDDIKQLTKKEIFDAHKKYAKFIRSRIPLVDMRWL